MYDNLVYKILFLSYSVLLSKQNIPLSEKSHPYNMIKQTLYQL